MVSRPLREEVRVPGTPQLAGVGTYVVRAGDLIFVSSFTAHDEHGRAVGGSDAGAQVIFLQGDGRRTMTGAAER